MATIQARKRADGTKAYRAIVRIKHDGVVVHTESRTFDQKKTAERWAALREAELTKPGEMMRAKTSSVLLGEVIRKYRIEFDVANEYGRSKLADLKRLEVSDIAKIPVARLQSSDYVQHIRRRRTIDRVSPATATNDLAWLRVVLRTARPAWGIGADLQQIDDAVTLCRRERLVGRSRQRERRPTIPELDRLLDYFTHELHRSTIPMGEVILFALFSGRRDSEICRLAWADVNETRRTGIVRDMKHPRDKRGNDVEVYFPEEAWAVIQRQDTRATGLVFPYNPKSVSSAFTRACRFLEIPDLHFHDLRHECASWLFERGWDIPRVSQVTGHRSWSSLQRYTHLRDFGTLDRYRDWSWRPS